MDRRVMQARGNILDFLNEIADTSHELVSSEVADHLQAAVDAMGEPEGSNNELSPGQKQALEASGPALDDITIESKDSLTPGQRAALNA